MLASMIWPTWVHVLCVLLPAVTVARGPRFKFVHLKTCPSNEDIRRKHASMLAKSVRNNATVTEPLRIYTLIHIPKCGGASVHIDLVGHDKVLVARNAKFEVAYPGDNVETGVLEHLEAPNEWCSGAARRACPESYQIVFLRSPRGHVLSQYGECAYDSWGRQKTASTHFPRDNRRPYDGFKAWVDVFYRQLVEGKTSWTPFNCYHPFNMQARYLDPRCTVGGCGPSAAHHAIALASTNFTNLQWCALELAMGKKARAAHAHDHGTQPQDKDNTPGTGTGTGTFLEPLVPPDLDKTIQTLSQIEFFGLIDYYTESMCLIVAGLAESQSGRALSKGFDAAAFFENKCFRECDDSASVVGGKEQQQGQGSEHHAPKVGMTHFKHHGGGGGGGAQEANDIGRVDGETLSKIDALTEVDQKLFLAAIKCFFQRIKAMEKRTGRRVLCLAAVEQSADGLAYLGADTVAIYNDSQPDARACSAARGAAASATAPAAGVPSPAGKNSARPTPSTIWTPSASTMPAAVPATLASLQNKAPTETTAPMLRDSTTDGASMHSRPPTNHNSNSKLAHGDIDGRADGGFALGDTRVWAVIVAVVAIAAARLTGMCAHVPPTTAHA